MVNELLKYYDENKRDLPWRKSRDPYGIWISEIMCQQTRVDTVIPYYLRFLDKYPSIESLAKANDDELMKMWQGLGYYNRARNLKKAAIEIVEKHKGIFPKNYDEVIKLPGIGEYTAAAILSMAFEQPYASVDGNFLRVFSRFYNDKSDIASENTKKMLTQKLEAEMPSRSGDFNQAVMDLGATICIPNEEPRCEKCPLIHECIAFKEKSYLDVPYSSKETKIKDLDYSVFLLQIGEQYVIRKRPENGLLAGLYEFVNVQGTQTIAQVQKRFKTKDVTLHEAKTHHFSHQTWHMFPYVIKLNQYVTKEDELLVSKEELLTKYSIPKAFNQFLQLM